MGVKDGRKFSPIAGENCPNLQQRLRYARRVARHTPTEFVVNKIVELGDQPVMVMRVVADLRERGIGLRAIADGIDTMQSTEVIVPRLLFILSEMERVETRMRTSEAVRHAQSEGIVCGRPFTMTPERQAIAVRMLAQGKSGREVLDVVKAIRGPNISRSAYYLWQKRRMIDQQSPGARPSVASSSSSTTESRCSECKSSRK
ncbi:recombinase family protein [Paracoccus methylarcula]|nr:recombinase family protein [Paracoccus methylarcula]